MNRRRKLTSSRIALTVFSAGALVILDNNVFELIFVSLFAGVVLSMLMDAE